jgi:hypothetical protein
MLRDLFGCCSSSHFTKWGTWYEICWAVVVRHTSLNGGYGTKFVGLLWFVATSLIGGHFTRFVGLLWFVATSLIGGHVTRFVGLL